MKRNARLQQNARELRVRLTPAEKIVWRVLRDRRMKGFKFRRQHPIGPYIADFCCLDAKLVIELDGDSHTTRRGDDQKRDAWLRRHGYEVVRCWNPEVYDNIDGLAERVWKLCCERTPPEFLPEAKLKRRPPLTPGPSPRRGEGR